MNTIVTPVTEDGQVGYDDYGQFVTWEKRGDSTIGTIIADVRAKTCMICGKGWEPTGPGLRNQYQLRDLEGWAHQTCYIGYLTLREGMMFYNAIATATQKLHDQAIIGWRMRTIANEYRGAWNTPWYQYALVRYPKDSERRYKHDGDGTGFSIKIGPRKRVYHVSLHRTDFDFHKYHPVTKDSVTVDCGPGYLMAHAWNEADLKTYLEAMVKIVIENTTEP